MQKPGQRYFTWDNCPMHFTQVQNVGRNVPPTQPYNVIIETPNLACGFVFTKFLQKNQF